ncbi:hypothetical protein HN681_01850 [archaeon]|jgi:hypothetical protein|nr:hypothetical protein [archaeon]MBT3731096.1 hypothetical protein [archaeon]MBT4670209.1 hypothetical protein [archaeon]MBT5030501.1 hypothetical protein [archaeon]MBT5287854.1 hypothetical protein [archaeon]
MKKIIFILMVLIISLSIVSAEDMVVEINGEEVVISDEEINAALEDEEFQDYVNQKNSGFVLEFEGDLSEYGVDLDSISDEDLVELEKKAIIQQLDLIKEKINMDLGNYPAAVLYVIEDEKINLYLEGDYVIGIEFGNAEILNIQNSELEDPSINIKINDQVFIDMSKEELDLLKALDAGDLSYEGVGFINKVKVGVSKVGLKVFRWFS